ncbi:Hypothetical predicted protein [Mytilus galloprovincialis]|uniref:Mab-21-like HhH/H2TH-like domain-containing protein n=1 Tax=Mytilus galloprovincialis TaxID=29158 RepID=A0A8B6HGW5_MYTGA|nr:Hypothetical predicted protein [Mytilus galloprovincialis]
MEINPRNEDKNMHGMRKIMFLQKYGVKSFPYSGRRRNTPSISQSLDGGIVISNDVFGLTIKQFEQTYIKCLNRRKTQEQWILNLRYPNKSSNEYLEYLQDCVYYNRGTEMNIHNRQRLFIIQDMMCKLSDFEMTQISSGSLAEGLDLPGSDLDVMFLIKNVDVIQNIRNIKHPIRNPTLVMELDNAHPGFTKLRLIADGQEELVKFECCESTTNGSYLSVKEFLLKINHRLNRFKMSVHGPCISTSSQSIDLAVCLRSKSLPNSVIPWARRHRHKWPPNFAIDEIVKYGCLLVPIGPRTISDNTLLWRLSFSVAEKQLVHSFNFTQLLCYGLLKLTLKRIINKNDSVKDLLCSYFLKTALFWVSEEVDIEIFKLLKLFHCFILCLDKLVLWIHNCYCPNYFIPKHNMFLGKIDQSNNKKLLSVLDSIKCGGIDGLIKNLFPNESGNHNLFKTTSFMMLDFNFYRIGKLIHGARNSYCCYKLLQYVKYLQMFESSKFIIDVCEYLHGKYSQNAVQCLPPPTKICKTNTLHKRYHRHLQDGIRTDSVSGWLLYASFYYVTGQYKVTLTLIDYVLSRCNEDMVYLSWDIVEKEYTNSYRQNVHPKLTLADRMKLATVNKVDFIRHSSLIPEEIQLEVENAMMSIPPAVLSYCLKFLSHHHLGDVFNRQLTLYDLFLTVHYNYFVTKEEISDSLTILGVCAEIAGDKCNAYECYNQALKCEDCVCHSAEARKLKLS